MDGAKVTLPPSTVLCYGVVFETNGPPLHISLADYLASNIIATLNKMFV